MTIPQSQETSFEALFQEGTDLLHRGEAVEATPLLEQAHRLDPDHVDAATNLSGAYILSGKFRKAVPLLEALVAKEPENAMLWINMGAAYLGNPVLARDAEQQKAVTAFRRALEIDPVAPSAAYNLGLIYRDRKDVDQAIYWFKEAIRANPKDRHARNILKRLTEFQETEP